MPAMPETPSLLCGDLCQKSDGSLGALKCGLCPLTRFYVGATWLLPDVMEIDSLAIPQPQQNLLAHERDMTTTLEGFYGDRAGLLLLRSETEGDLYQREVVLVMEQSGRRVEFGAITIHLEHFPLRLRRDIERAEAPLGTLLHRHEFAFLSRPKSFIRVASDPLINRVLALDTSEFLYGRCNALFTPAGALIADIVEILPT